MDGITCIRSIKIHDSIVMSLSVQSGRILSRSVKGKTLVCKIPTDDDDTESEDSKLILHQTQTVMLGFLQPLVLGDRHFLAGHANELLLLYDVWKSKNMEI